VHVYRLNVSRHDQELGKDRQKASPPRTPKSLRKREASPQRPQIREGKEKLYREEFNNKEKFKT
jgi:hypothetical protein